MTLQHAKRTRNKSRRQVAYEWKDVDAVEPVNESPSEADIRVRAYEIYLGRDGAPGNAEVDWLQAGLELSHAALRP